MERTTNLKLEIPDFYVDAADFQVFNRNMETLDKKVGLPFAAMGTSTGTATALSLAASGFELKDGATIKLKLHVNIGSNATLNVGGTGAKKIKTITGGTNSCGAVAGSWIMLMYNGTDYIVTGGGGGSGGVLFRATAPASVEDRDKLWVCTDANNALFNVPQRWNGSAWAPLYSVWA